MIDESNAIISFDTEVVFVCDQPLLHETGSCKILNIDGNNLKVDNIANITVGTKLKQETFEASLQKLSQKFAEEWTKRWDKHLLVEVDRWHPLVEFFTHNVPRVPEQEYKPITIHQWKTALRRKRAKAAIGPDGWSKWDLLSLPDDLTQQLLD